MSFGSRSIAGLRPQPKRGRQNRRVIKHLRRADLPAPGEKSGTREDRQRDDRDELADPSRFPAGFPCHTHLAVGLHAK